MTTPGPLLEFESVRLKARSLTLQDESLYCELYCDERTMRFIGPPWSRQRARRNLRKALDAMRGNPPKQLILAVVEKTTERGLGICSLQHIDEQRGAAEIGVMLKPDCHSSGLAKELTSALVMRVFQAFALDTIQARITAEHLVAERVLVGVGFSRGDDRAVEHDDNPGQKVLSVHRGSWLRRAAIRPIPIIPNNEGHT